VKQFEFQLFAVGLIFVCSAMGIRSVFVLEHSVSFEGERHSGDGQGIYIAEGCINCHSQYVRDGTLDTEIWGPATLQSGGDDAFLLIGNRRQGPDLSNVGVRRSREWNRAHLINPELLTAGSRMPSYVHLFERGHTGEGEALLDYLDTLVAKDSLELWNYVLTWNPSVGIDHADLGEGQRSFANSCAQCHGSDGRGEGQAASLFANSPRNLVLEPFRFAPDSLDEADRQIRLAQIIKFGIAGTSMPGHESLTDKEIVDLLAYLESLREDQTES
jgi:mono/diheme cytochrome c family protein